VDFLNLRVTMREGSAIGDVQVFWSAVPQRQSIKIASQPLQDEPCMHNLATRVNADLGKLGLRVRFCD